MAAEAGEGHSPVWPIDREGPVGDAKGCYLHKFQLYETRSKFYMIGRDKGKTLWKVLKIDRLEPCELNIREDSSTYSERECHDLLKRIHEGNRSTGGLKFVTNCYGIVGFIKFLGPYYMLLITKRKQIGAICGHIVYAITKSEMITLPNSTVWSDVANSRNENRYKKLLCTVDLTKDFYFSYSYHVMRSLQKNLCDSQSGQAVYDSMFVWNEFLTRGIRNHLKNTLWTVALVYGFFKQSPSLGKKGVGSDWAQQRNYYWWAVGTAARGWRPLRFSHPGIQDADGHTNWVSCVRFSPNTFVPTIVSASWDRTIKVWNLSNCKLRFTLTGHGGYVNTVAVSPDGSLCASGGKDGVTLLWDLAEGKRLYTLEAGAIVHALCFSPNRYWLCVATQEGIKIWDLESKLVVQDLKPDVTTGKNQAKLSISGRDFMLTLIARRSRHYAGTRYLKRGVNGNGEVANDVETEQIVFEDASVGHPSHITSIVQNRGSIPLFWSQETSRLNLKPDIVLHRKDQNYEATRLHFENLMKRYGNPIIILNLIKTHEKKPRESILRAEFANAIDFINKHSSEENHLRFLHWDLHRHSRSKAANVLAFLGRVAAYSLNLTGFFYCQVRPSLEADGLMKLPVLMKGDGGNWSYVNSNHNGAEIVGISEDSSLKPPPLFQNGVLRTNCIDCLDRTNVAQYAYGLAALGHQLHALGLVDVPKIDLDAQLADDLMSFYERMGDTLALQYGGSAAHNKIFCKRRGQWTATIQSQEFFRTLQRYYSNAYMDAEKQEAINVFLGYFQPQQGESSLWEMDYSVKKGHNYVDDNSRSFFEKSLSDGSIVCESCTPVSSTPNGQNKLINSALRDKISEGRTRCYSDSTPEMSICESDVSYSRYSPPSVCRELFAESAHVINGHGADPSNWSNFLDIDYLSSSGNSCEEEIYDRSSIVNSPSENISTESLVNGTTIETAPMPKENGYHIMQGQDSTEKMVAFGAAGNLDKPTGFSDSFVQWVVHGETLCH